MDIRVSARRFDPATSQRSDIVLRARYLSHTKRATEEVWTKPKEREESGRVEKTNSLIIQLIISIWREDVVSG